jgi:predicted SAM-dependent methyltransferase
VNFRFLLWKEFLVPIHQTIMVPIRRRYYRHGQFRWLQKLPWKLKKHLGLEEPPLDQIRLEIGAGGQPQRGYLHLDVDRNGWHLEFVRGADRLPFADNSVQEIYASHVLEHIPPYRLVSTLQEWHRILQPSGRVEVHVPNMSQLSKAFQEGDVTRKWAVVAALFGHVSANAAADHPDKITGGARHQSCFDFALLQWTLASAGFIRVKDLTEEACDHYCEEWQSVVPHLSVVVEAYKPVVGSKPDILKP